MPIRSTRGRAAAYRGMWQWPLRSPARLAVTVAAVVAVGVAVGVGVPAAGGGADSAGLPDLPPRPSSRVAAPRTPEAGGPGTSASTALPPVPQLQPTAAPVSEAPTAALVVASRWATAWVRPPDGTTAEQWREGLRATTTQEYLGVLGSVDPTNIPSTLVTGRPRPVQVSEGSVQAEVPTDAVTLLVLVVDTETGWRVAGYDRVGG